MVQCTPSEETERRHRIAGGLICGTVHECWKDAENSGGHFPSFPDANGVVLILPNMAKSKMEWSAFNSAAANMTELKFTAYGNSHLSAQTKDLRDVLLCTKSPAESTTAVRYKGADEE